jgi:hypothetical protein
MSCQPALQVAAALQADVQHLAAADGQHTHGQAVLAQRCGELEREAALLRQQLQQRDAELEAAVERAAARQLAAAEQRWQQALLPAAVEAAVGAAVQRWADEALPRLLQPVQEAVAAVTELSAGLAADVAGLAGRVEDLFERCRRAAAADSNHEERLCRLEEAGMQAPPPSDGCGELEQLQQQVQGLQRGHAQLSEGLQGLLQGQVVAAAAAAEQPWPLQASPHSQLATQQRGNAAADLTAVEEQLAAVAEQQAQQARTTEQLVSSGETGVWGGGGGGGGGSICTAARVQRCRAARLTTAVHQQS